MMTKGDFVALADALRPFVGGSNPHPALLASIADFCASRNANFKRERWLDYVNGKRGVNGGEVRS